MSDLTAGELADRDDGSERQPDDVQLYTELPASSTYVLLLSISAVALCGIVYELIIGTVSSYLLGNSVYQFSLTIGFFMFAMGIGSYLSKFLGRDLVQNFVLVEVVLAMIGGVCSLVLFFTFPFAPALYKVVMFGFIFVIGALVGLEIPLLTRILAQASGTRRSIANVMSLDYVGALIGSVAFPLMLLPSLGLMRSSFAIGLINIAVAFITVVYLRNYIPNPKRMYALIAIVFVALTTLTFLSSRLTSLAQDHLYFDQIIWKKHTKYQNLIVTQAKANSDLRLYIDGHIQFSESDEHRYHEALVHPVMGLPGKAENVLVMGGGDGLAVRELLKHSNIKRIDLVDLDPGMTELGKEFAPLVRLNKSSLDDPRVRIFNEDAFVFVRRDGIAYDRVILDFPDPHNEAISKLYSIEFYTMLKRRMSPDGAVVTQSSSPFFARRAYWAVAETMAPVFSRPISYQIAIPAFGVWGFHLASLSDDARKARVSVPTRYLTTDVFRAAQTFGKDIARPSEVVRNSIFEPILYGIYLADLNRGKSQLGFLFSKTPSS